MQLHSSEYFKVSYVVFVANMVVVKVEGDPILCKTDEVGELCISSAYVGVSYWGLKGVSANVFRVSYVCSVCYVSLRRVLI